MQENVKKTLWVNSQDLKRVFEFEYVAIQVTCILLYYIKDTVILNAKKKIGLKFISNQVILGVKISTEVL